MKPSHAKRLDDIHVYVLMDHEIFTQLSLRSTLTATERVVLRELETLNCRTTVRAFASARSLLCDLEELRPDLVLNLTDWAYGERRGDAYIVSVLELSGVPYTGCTVWTLLLCRDKALSKLIAKESGVDCPRFSTIGRAPHLRSAGSVPLPVVVKPRFGDASDGIAAAALCRTKRAADARCRFIVREYGDAIIEEFIRGREFSVSFLDGQLFSPRELVWPAGCRFNIFTDRIKHDRKVRNRARLKIKRMAVPQSTARMIKQECVNLFRAFGVRGYGRVDAVLVDERLCFLEMNPNPGLDLASSISRPWGRLSPRTVVARLLLSALTTRRRQELLTYDS